MPPSKPTAKPRKPPSASKEVISLGPRDVFKNSGAGRPDTFRERPTTTKALVLRNGKYGAMGSGELVLLSKIGGREKLDLLAEDYTAKAARAVATPFRLEQCVKIAESQLNVYLDGINALKEPELFADKIRDEVHSRKSGSDRNPSFVASVVGSTVHNMYMLASAWNLVWQWLEKLAEYGLQDTAVKGRLRRDETFRSIYFVLHRLVQVIADAEQTKFAVLATSAEHFTRYFKLTEDEADDPEWIFDWASLKVMHKSFLDSIVVELCLPNSQYSKQIMLQLLEEATTESPKEIKRFPQALWDAVGDFSVTVQMLAIVEAPLLGAEGEALQKLPHDMPDEYESWIDAQLFSAKASQQYANYKDIIFPLERTKTRQTLDTMWRYINLNYKTVSGLDIDALWDLEVLFKEQTPRFHGYYIHKADEESEKIPGAFPSRSLRQIPGTNAEPEESYEGMPGLQSVSSSEDDGDSESGWESGGGHWDEDDWDTEDEDGVNEDYREMMKVGMEHPDFLDPRVPIPEFDKYAEERKGNPFLKLLGSLRGRMFSSNAALRTTDRTTPRNKTTVPAQRSTKATVEDIEDEEDEGRSAGPKKKKKKKPKKKKPATALIDNKGTDDVTEPVSPLGPDTTATPPQSPTPSTQEPQSPNSISSPSKKKKKKRSSSRSDSEPRTSLNLDSSLNASASTFGFQLPVYASTTSLPLPEPQRAQSARSYVRSEGLTEKTKVKSRPHGPTLEPIKEKKGFWSKFSRKEKKEEKKEEDDDIVPRENWTVRMKEQTKMYMRQMIGTKDGLQPMKWENFLKIMREMGFDMDPSTAGSSVRFDPPNPKDRSIVFHKPHPDPTLSPWKVREFGKRLKDYYGWIEDDFMKRAGERD